MNAVPEQKTIRDLLSCKKQFIIPRFQREYSWEKQNYSEFFNDIIYGIKYDKSKPKSQKYFLGTMLFIGDFNDSRSMKLDVVDGQQRLTNITILLSALSKRFKDIGKNELANNVFKYIMDINDDNEKIRILNTITSHPYFLFYVQEQDKKHDNEVAISDEEKLIKETYDYFYKQLDKSSFKEIEKNIGNKISDRYYIKILQSIRDEVLDANIISITTKDKKEGSQIFEILNAKGKKLTFIDLIKSRIFGVLSQRGDSEFAIKKWDELKKVLMSEKENIGLATFFRHYWASKFGRVSTERIYAGFKKKIKDNNYESFLKELVYEAKNYIKVVLPSRDQYNNRKQMYTMVQSLDVISNTFNIVQTRVLFLTLFYLYDKKLLSIKKLLNTVKFIEDFHFAYNAVASQKTNKIDPIYSKFSVKARAAKDANDVNKYIDEFLVAELMKIFPKYDVFLSGFKKLFFSKKEIPSNCRTKYAINKINSYYNHKDLFDDYSSVEHIIDEDLNCKETLEIGNLVSLEMKINNTIPKSNYTDKIKYYKKSKYQFVKTLIKEYSDFTKENIHDRTNKLAKLYYEKIIKMNV